MMENYQRRDITTTTLEYYSKMYELLKDMIHESNIAIIISTQRRETDSRVVSVEPSIESPIYIDYLSQRPIRGTPIYIDYLSEMRFLEPESRVAEPSKPCVIDYMSITRSVCGG